MAYYITGRGGAGKYYYAIARDYFSALILLDEARRKMPGESWAIKAYKI